MDGICLIYLFIQFNFMFLSEDRGEIRVEDKIKKIKEKREFQKRRKAHEKQKVIKTVRVYKKTKRNKAN